MTEVEKVAEVLSARYEHVRANATAVWPCSAQRVVDCVLSLNRPYNSFVKPRVEAFGSRHPEIGSLSALSGLVARYESPHAFSAKELDYNDRRRAETLVGVLAYLLDAIVDHPGVTEDDKLQHWATWCRPGDYLTVGVPGFGLAGFQYLRMLFGAQTAKPDVHIVNFVSEIVGRKVTPVQALNILERAAKLSGLPLREVDAAIWNERARP